MSVPPARNPAVPCLFSKDEIAARVEGLARQLAQDYAQRYPLIVGVLKGGWVFMADLVRRLGVPLECDFVKLSSYGMGTSTSGEVRLDLDICLHARGREVLIVEDIVDTGFSLRWLLEHLQAKGPAGLRVCTLLDKPNRRRVDVSLDYVGFTIADQFVVGFGIDHAERYRELPYIGYLLGEGGTS